MLRRYPYNALKIRSFCSLPIAANMRDIGAEYETICAEFNKHRHDKAGLLKMRSLGRDIICPYSPQTLRECALKAVNEGTSHWPDNIYLLMGQHSVVTLTGEKHKTVRKVLNPLFLSEQSIESRFNIISQSTDQLIHTLTEQTKIQPNEYHNIWPICKYWAWDIAMHITVGDQIYNHKDKYLIFDNKYSSDLCMKMNDWALGFGDVNIENANNPDTVLGKAMITRKELIHDINILIDKCSDALMQNQLDPKCTMYQLLKNEDKWSKEMLIDTVMILMNASHDTTASSANNIVYVLNKFPKQRERLLYELETVDVNNYREVQNNEYLDAFVHETMRYIPTAPFTPKKFYHDVYINNYLIPKDAIYEIHNIGLSRNEGIFENANEFEPMRWITNDIDKYSWTPFGHGTKICLGWKLAILELKIFATIFATKCEFEIDQTRLKVADSFFNFYDIYAKIWHKN